MLTPVVYVYKEILCIFSLHYTSKYLEVLHKKYSLIILPLFEFNREHAFHTWTLLI